MVNNKSGVCSLELGETMYHEDRKHPIFKYVSGEGLVTVGYISWDEYIKQSKRKKE